MTEGIDTEVWVEEFLTDLIEKTGLDVAIEELSLDNEDVLQVQLGGQDSARMIGREGQVLDALQHIVVTAAIHNGLGRQRVVVDVERYRSRRELRLRDDAQRFAEEVLSTGRPLDFHPMSPRDRRLVHITVAEMNGVVTESLGQGADRFVRIKPAE
ncbi:MAG: R3H domain-containing nucleic acid-binding protein [Myxococcota bacterium]|nr:R3H domain-containing nucleic acid-binding protein [Myxococcota bacterium]